jgi:hypothetical protein
MMIILFAEGGWLRESSWAVWLGDSGEFADTGLCSRSTASVSRTKSQNGKDLLAADTLSAGGAK